MGVVATGKDLRECQLTGRWFRNASACLMMGRCEYFPICTGALDLDGREAPAGFEFVSNLHPELNNDDK